MFQIFSSQEFTETLEMYDIVFVDWYAEWCGPCKRIAPFVHDLKKKYKNVFFAKIDVDDCDGLAMQQGVRSMPTFQFFKKGKLVDEVVGASQDALVKALDTLTA